MRPSFRQGVRGSARNGVVVAACLVLLAVSGVVVCRQLRSSDEAAANQGPQIEWFCPKCQSSYKAPAMGGDPSCPQCGQIGDCVHTYRCTKCGETFEAFRTRIRTGQPMLMKRPDGDWAEYVPEDISVRCPQCGGAAARVSPPEL